MIISGQVFDVSLENFLRLNGIPISRSDLLGWSGFSLQQFLPCAYYGNGFTSSANIIEDQKSLDALNSFISEQDFTATEWRFFLVSYDLVQKLKLPREPDEQR